MKKNETNASKLSPQSEVDLGYPTPAYGGIPSFRNVEEEAAFWDTHSILDFPVAIESIEFIPARDRKDTAISIRLDRSDRTRLKAEAAKMGIGPSTLARIWIKERLAG
jgi:predicted DNA binding CopG/RHH family protein